ncbi:hypothetical protein HYT52_04190 [Candidatus Woesearchaeota archaeon]|nr:hypothetical protein [Candidatus Woesearchaeota archaeon]
MSQASKHVEWCLNKAMKEIEECKKLGKRQKHRGLLKNNPDLEEAKKHLAKAEHDLDGITKFREIGFSDWSMSAGFYCIYHNFLAIAAKFGYESSNQTCTIALMRFLKETGKISFDEKFIEALEYEELEESKENSVIELREDYTYGVQITVKDEAKINELKKICKELIDITKEIIYK